MIYIEDILLKIFQHFESKVNPWSMPYTFSLKHLPECPEIAEITERYDRQFLWDLGYKVKNGHTFSSKQATLLVKILSKYKLYISTLGFDSYSLDNILQSPNYKNQPYESKTTKREVRYLGDNLIAFRFLYNPQIIDELKKIKATSSKGNDLESLFEFNGKHKIWLVEATKDNYQKIMKFIKSFSFYYEEDLEYFFLLCENTNNKNFSVNKIDDSNLYEIITINDRLLSFWLAYHIKMDEIDA